MAANAGFAGNKEGLSRQDRLHLLTVFVFGGAMSIVASVAVGFWFFRQAKSNMDKPPSKPVLLSVKSSELLSSCANPKGNAASPYSLVEFMDYQCGPCRKRQAEVNTTVAAFDGKLRFYVKNYPLSFHKQARGAAVAAQFAKANGDFWRVHERLMTTASLNKASLAQDLKASGVDPSPFTSGKTAQAEQQVDQDIAMGHRLGVNGTPTFFLCCPDQHIYRLTRLNQIKDLLR